MPAKQLKNSKIEMDNNERGKKLPTLSPSSSSTFAPRWMAKGSSESRSTSPTSTSAVSDENFPSLANSGDEVKKKRSVWNDPSTVKRKVISASLPGGEDPFAGMNTRVDYQQEIERLKALVPKVEKKTKVAARPKSTGSDLKQSQRMWSDSTATATIATATSGTRQPARSPSTKPRSTTTYTTTTRLGGDDLVSVNTAAGGAVTSSNGSPGSTTTPTLITATSTPAADMSTSSADEDEEENPPGPAITEEEKLRFLEFMRSWTGCWQGWDRSNNNNSGSMDTITVTKDSSLWAGRSPWEREPIVARRPDFSSAHLSRIQPDTSTPSAYDPFLPFLHGRSPHPPATSTTTTTPTTSRYYREDLYPQYDPQQVGTIGEKYRQNNTYRRDNGGYGVFVM